MKLKNVMLIVLVCCMITVAFSLPQIKTVYTVEAKNVDYGWCNLKTDVCVAEYLAYDQNTPDGYVKYAMTRAGLEDEIPLVMKMIKCESNWRTDAIGVNRNGTTDLGLWQRNQVHIKTLSNADAFDYKKATDWAINKRLNDGGWQAWSCLNKIR